MSLTDFKVRVIESGKGTNVKVIVYIQSTDGVDTWSTVGVSTDVIQASYQALADSIEYLF